MVCERCGTVLCWDEADTVPQDGRQRKRFCSESCKSKASRKRTGRKTREDHKRRQKELCQAQNKRKYPDIVAARNAAGNILKNRGWVLYPYWCEYGCGFFHLTKQPPKSTEDDLFIMRRWAAQNV